jgi:hypothetical protein
MISVKFCWGHLKIETLKGLLMLPLVILWMLAGPVTFILSVVETWHGTASVPVKLLINVTFDAFLAGIWPITWALWGIQTWLGHPSPINLVFG